MPPPRVFTIPASAPFLPTLIRALRDGQLVEGFPGGGDPLTWSRATLFLPTAPPAPPRAMPSPMSPASTPPACRRARAADRRHDDTAGYLGQAERARSRQSRPVLAADARFP